VASRTASFELDRSNLDMATIGSRLGVRHVLEGSVRRSGDQVRIVAQLIDAPSGYHLWSSRYDRQINDLFRIYDDISSALATELQLTLAPNVKLVLEPPTANMQAYDYFLQARSILQRVTRPENAANAVRFFSSAVQLDPEFAEAWAGHCRAELVWYGYAPAPDRIGSAEHSCSTALMLDHELAEAHVALGDLNRVTGKFEAAVEDYQRGLHIDEKLAMGWRGLGRVLDDLGREAEAEGALRKAIDYDPDDLLNFEALGDFLFDRGRYAQAVDTYRQLVAHPRAGAAAYNSLGAALLMTGDAEQASTAFRQVISLDPTASAYSNVGVAYYLLGRYEDSVVMYRESVALAPDDAVTCVRGEVGSLTSTMDSKASMGRPVPVAT
jgi:adenylate cyclase